MIAYGILQDLGLDGAGVIVEDGGAHVYGLTREMLKPGAMTLPEFAGKEGSRVRFAVVDEMATEVELVALASN